MKKKFPTFFNDTCNSLDEMTVSAGIKGCQLLLKRKELVDFTGAVLCDLIKEE